MHKIDFGFISKFEGGQWLKGYVPAASTSQSGVTIATGFDLGARNEQDLKNLRLPATLITKLKPYLGKQRGDATAFLAKNPLTITKMEADAIDQASKSSFSQSIISTYDAAVAANGGRLKFAQLFAEAQTVIASVAFQYGSLPKRTPKFWRTVVDHDWRSAVLELRNFGDAYGTRRKAEADLLDRGLHAVNTQPDAPPLGSLKEFWSFFGSLEFSNILGGASSSAAERKTIVGSVGKGGKNLADDVRVVQRLLNNHIRVPRSPLPVNGTVDSRLVDAIAEFQSRVVGLASPDGRVDPGGRTLKALGSSASSTTGASASSTSVSGTSVSGSSVSGGATQVATGAAQTGSTIVTGNGTKPGKGGPRCFPFAVVTKWSWEEAPRSFGSTRDHGARAHGGCDLYYPEGTVIYAVADGKVIAGPYPFYCQTYALEVDHGDFIVRYGEIGSATVKAGEIVKMGQPIAKVGHLVGIKVQSDMLHFEMFSGKATGSLSSGGAKRGDGVPFKRRSDLLDPTPYLNEWKKNLPKP